MNDHHHSLDIPMTSFVMPGPETMHHAGIVETTCWYWQGSLH